MNQDSTKEIRIAHTRPSDCWHPEAPGLVSTFKDIDILNDGYSFELRSNRVRTAYQEGVLALL